jgi:ankyrin repeat protein
MAAQNGHAAVAAMLLEAGARMDLGFDNNTGCTPLYIAAQLGHDGVVATLVDAGADVNEARDQQLGITPLLISAINGRHGEPPHIYSYPDLIVCPLCDPPKYSPAMI